MKRAGPGRACPAILFLAGLLLVGLAVPAAAPPPTPMRSDGRAYDLAGNPLGPGTPIRAFVDGVDYSNAPSVRDATGGYIALTYGNWMTAQGDPDTPSLQKGADLGDIVLFAEGDSTTATAVFEETAAWAPGRILSLDLNEGSPASTPEPLKIQRVLTQPAQGGAQAVWVCNPT